jgi:hypothetical protein
VTIDMVELVEDAPPPTAARRFADLCGMLVWSVALSALFAAAWALFVRHGDWSALTTTFFVTTAAARAVLLPSGLWTGLKALEDSWTRRLVLMCCGFGVGLFALWLEGYTVPLPWETGTQADALQPWTGDSQPGDGSFFMGLYRPNRSMPLLACYLGYFGLMFLVLRWWKNGEPTRGKRFSLKPVIATVFWGYILLFMLPGASHRHTALISLALASAVLQTVSPWKERVALAKKKCRLPAAAQVRRVAI